MSGFQDFITAAEKGAASIYHKVLSTGTLVSDWEAEHPALAPLVKDGMAFANGLLAKFGLSVDGVEVAAEDIMAALRGLLAHDATVPSVPIATTTTTTTGPLLAGITVAADVAAVIDPALAPAVTALEDIAQASDTIPATFGAQAQK